ncbi:MAG TPA: hypothetical protein VIV06_08880 [Candidatus Limnocylindrales bacterium]
MSSDDAAEPRIDPMSQAAPGDPARDQPAADAPPTWMPDDAPSDVAPGPIEEIPLEDAPTPQDVAAAPAFIAPIPASQDALRTSRSALVRPLATLGLFVASLAIGAFAFAALNPAPAPVKWPPLADRPEPAAAHDLINAIKQNDPHVLAGLVDGQVLTDLGTALDPLVEVPEVEFLGAVGRSGDDFAAYLLHGQDVQGQKAVIGIVLHVRDGKVVAVNS